MKTELLKREEAIRFVKDTFAKELSHQLKLIPVSSPIAVLDGSGVNDTLNGIERSVSFPVKAQNDRMAVVVNSLAKWKRVRLKELGIDVDQGILTDMRALRPDEDYTHLHSVYVDQWDWEKRITAETRTLDTLKAHVLGIYQSLCTVEKELAEKYPELDPILPDAIYFIHSEELLQRYPKLSSKEREDAICKIHGAVFIIGVGAPLSDGEYHDGRAPDYDDWISTNEAGFKGLNGDLLVWHPVLKHAVELSSMGIRVDAQSLLAQLKERDKMELAKLPFHRQLLTEALPASIGGGIGQSRLCLFLLRKRHIGEVQVGIWAPSTYAEMEPQNIVLM